MPVCPSLLPSTERHFPLHVYINVSTATHIYSAHLTSLISHTMSLFNTSIIKFIFFRRDLHVFIRLNYFRICFRIYGCYVIPFAVLRIFRCSQRLISQLPQCRFRRVYIHTPVVAYIVPCKRFKFSVDQFTKLHINSPPPACWHSILL